VLENLKLALEELGPDFHPEIVEMLQNAAEGAERIRRVVGDLKTFSRGEDETQRDVDVERVIESSISMASNEIRHRAELVKDFGRVPAVKANESRLGQVFLNLLMNAAEAIPEGRASSNRIRISTRLVVDRVVVEVSDSGAGILPADLPHIFQGFFTTKPFGNGTGLGLSISRDIVNAIGGTIEVDSTVGSGSTFRISLPVATSSARVRSAPTPAPGTRRGRVLVIDDEPLVGLVLRRSLGREHDVTLTSGAHEAFALLRKGDQFDAIFCDLMMPDVTGMDFHEQLERELPEQAQKVVFLTGGSFTSRAREFLDQTAQPVVEKPFDGKALRALVREFVEHADAKKSAPGD
jgi:CheY-like chemotaxis protein